MPSLRFPPFLLLLALTACSDTPPVDPADTVFVNGNVITIDDAKPAAEAVAVRDGRIVAVGSRGDIDAMAGPGTQRVDLGGKTLLPGFVDSHSHVYAVGSQALSANLLPAPDGNGNDIPALQAELRAWMADEDGILQGLGWVLGFGYDDSQLAEGRHPTRDELDAVSADKPVLIIHQSGHLGVANSVALALAGLDAESENPAGGVIRRRAGSNEPNGVLEETAFFGALGVLATKFDDDINRAFVIEGAALAARYGFTTVQEGRASSVSVDAIRAVADSTGAERSESSSRASSS